MTRMQTELKQRLVVTARAPEPWSTSVTCSLGVKRGKQLHSKGGLAEKNFSMKSMTHVLTWTSPQLIQFVFPSGSCLRDWYLQRF